MNAFRLRIGENYVEFVDVDTGRVILTDNPDEAGLFSEEGAAIVREFVGDLGTVESEC